MKFRKIKYFIIILFICSYFIFNYSSKISVSSNPCSHLYQTDSFERSNNLTRLLDEYFSYRTCVLQHRLSNVDYVIFDAVNGLGNRLLGLLSVTIYALVTNRILLINWKHGDNHLAYFHDLFLPLSPLNENSFYSQYSISRLRNNLRNRWINEIHSQMNIENGMPKDWSFYFDMQILCNDYQYKLSFPKQMTLNILNWFNPHFKWIRTDQYFLPLLTRNQRYRQTFMKLFPNGQIFNQLAQRILKPVEKVNLLVEDFQNKYNLTDEMITIGIHMRSWSSTTTDYIEPFEKCIQHVIQNITRINKKETKIYLYIISNNLKRRQRLEKQMSDSNKSIEILRLSAKRIMKMQYTLAELLILSKMKHLIITSKSTFGMIAQGLANKGAWIVRQGAAQETNSFHSNLCQWESTSEPEYQTMRYLQINNTCPQQNVYLPSIGERTVI